MAIDTVHNVKVCHPDIKDKFLHMKADFDGKKSITFSAQFVPKDIENLEIEYTGPFSSDIIKSSMLTGKEKWVFISKEPSLGEDIKISEDNIKIASPITTFLLTWKVLPESDSMTFVEISVIGGVVLNDIL